MTPESPNRSIKARSRYSVRFAAISASACADRQCARRGSRRPRSRLYGRPCPASGRWSRSRFRHSFATIRRHGSRYSVFKWASQNGSVNAVLASYSPWSATGTCSVCCPVIASYLVCLPIAVRSRVSTRAIRICPKRERDSNPGRMRSSPFRRTSFTPADSADPGPPGSGLRPGARARPRWRPARRARSLRRPSRRRARGPAAAANRSRRRRRSRGRGSR